MTAITVHRHANLVNDALTKRVGVKICKFANGDCECAGRPRLCERVESLAAQIIVMVGSEGPDNGH